MDALPDKGAPSNEEQTGGEEHVSCASLFYIISSQMGAGELKPEQMSRTSMFYAKVQKPWVED